MHSQGHRSLGTASSWRRQHAQRSTFEVIGNDVTVSFAAEAGQLQLNAFEPIIAHSLFKSVSHLRNGCLTLTERCVKGITANPEHLRASVGARSAS